MTEKINVHSQVNILVVDDNEKNIRAMKKVLEDLPINIYEALSGEEALKLVLRHTFAVVYLDVQMPGMDGYEVARCMGQNETTSAVPIVFVTAVHNSTEHIEEGYNAGAIDYLTKPINAHMLLAKTKIFIKLYEQRRRLRETVEALDKIANNDPLTGLSNRHQFNYVFDKVLANNQRHHRMFALLLLDLDNFKSVNDNLGHDIGDELLKHVAQKLTCCLRESDHVSRLGGDEFAILLSELNRANDASYIATKLLEELATPFIINNRELKITTSIGIATYPFASSNVKGLYKAADIALYRAKDGGKNIFEYYTETLNKAYVRRAEVEHGLQKAIEKQELTMRYQPRFNIKDRTIVGVEALARWNSKKLGSIPPDEFITIAEETGFITTLGSFLIEQSFEQFAEWQKINQDLTFSFAINLSPGQILSQSFTRQIKLLVEHYKLNVDQLEFELTESVFKGRNEDLETVLDEIRSMGFMISIDDFGTGYSSLSRIKSLPIQVLKIDRSFVSDITTDVNDAAIVKAVIALANALQLDVVAEGVESKEQAEFLLANGCTKAQGYYYAKPLTVKEIDELLK